MIEVSYPVLAGTLAAAAVVGFWILLRNGRGDPE
jgi:hypothetical protein